MSSHDYRINAEVRRLLVSRWVDVSMVQIGTTNGVVYLMGTFEPLVEDSLQRVGQVQERDPSRWAEARCAGTGIGTEWKTC